MMFKINIYSKLLLVLTTLLFFSPFQIVYSQNDIIIGKTLSLDSKILEKEMKLSIHIPTDYEISDERYPVLYIFQTHFEQVSGAVKKLYDYKLIPKMLVIQIANYEYGYLTPTKIEREPNSGQAEKFLTFFKTELFPYIDSKYRTQKYRIVFSNSWGAMFIVYSILNKPDIFNAGIASIPWIMYDGENKFLINNIKSFLENRTYNNFLFMTMDNELELLPELKKFIKILKDNPQPGLDWRYYHWPEEDHTSTPYRSINFGLRQLFHAWNEIPEHITKEGLDAIKDYENIINKKFNYNIGVSETALRLSGQYLKKQNMFKETIEIYKYTIEKNPKNSFAYITLGQVYEENNQLQLAKFTYEKAYQVALSTSHPQIKWVKNFVDNINKKINNAQKK